MAESDMSRVNAIGMGVSFVAGGIWVIYGLTGAPGWLLIVAILFSLVAGWWWAFGRRAMFPDAFVGAGRQRNRQRNRR